MISKAVWEKAENLEVVKVFENGVRIDFVVGVCVTFHKKFDRLTCNCLGHSAYNIGACSYKLAALLKGEGIPKELKDDIE